MVYTQEQRRNSVPTGTAKDYLTMQESFGYIAAEENEFIAFGGVSLQGIAAKQDDSSHPLDGFTE